MRSRARPARAAPPRRARAGSRSRSAELLANDLAIVERQLPAGDLLPLLVPLARDDDDVPRPGQLERPSDRPPPIELDLYFTVSSYENLVDDRLRLLAPRVVRGDDRHIGQRRGDMAHLRALAAVAVAAAAEDD